MLGLLLVFLLAAGCNAGGVSGGSSTKPGVISIVTAAYPFQFIAERVAASHAHVSNLTKPGAEPHDVELTLRQVGAMARANLVIYQRGFQPAVDEAVLQSGNQNVLETTTVVPVEDHGQEGDAHSGDEHGHEHTGPDPHVWLDPTNVAAIGHAVSDRLAALDPESANDYRANATRLEGELTQVDRRFRAGLASCERTEFITTHAAFGYLAERYGLTEIAIGGLSPDLEPSPARIAQVQQEARVHGITTIFFETLVSPAVAETLARDLGLQTDILDPLEGITPESRGTDYFSVMNANLAALRKANGCR
jgi:zinc transport system substrate-binding protein